MVRKIGLFFSYFIFFVLSLMYFNPKISVYYFLENELKKHNIVVSDEVLEDHGFSLEVQNANIFVESIKSANVENIDVKMLVLYNSIDVKNISLSKVATSFMPLNIKKLSVSYMVFNPLNIKMYAVGKFGELNGVFNLLDFTFHADLKPSQLMLSKYQNSMRSFKKNKNGEYVYDKNF